MNHCATWRQVGAWIPIADWLARFGMPAIVTTDRGTQFTSAVLTSTCTGLGIEHVLTTAFHPKSNRMVERMHLQIKDGLCVCGAGLAWHSHLHPSIKYFEI